jgi:hypothetical protein
MGGLTYDLFAVLFKFLVLFSSNFYSNSKDFPWGNPPNEGRLFFNNRNSLSKRETIFV